MTPWTVPLSMGSSRQEYWSGLPFSSPWGLPDPGIDPRSPTLQADSLPSEPPGKGMGEFAYMKKRKKKKNSNSFCSPEQTVVLLPLDIMSHVCMFLFSFNL